MVSFRIPGSGQRTRTFRTLTEAKDFQGGVRGPAGVEQARRLERGRVLLRDYFADWLVRKRRLAASTRLRYEGVGRNYIAPSRLGGTPISRITRDDIEHWIVELDARGV